MYARRETDSRGMDDLHLMTSISDFVDGAVNSIELHAVSVEYARKVCDGDPLAGARTYVFVMAQSSNTTMENTQVGVSVDPPHVVYKPRTL